MALCSDAAMVLMYDIAGDPADHDDWHSREHFHERLSVPGFLRATRWVATEGGPRFLVTYEVESVEVGTSEAYLARLNDPTPWTSAMMPRFRGMRRGFCHVAASAGFGLGAFASATRFMPGEGIADRIASDLMPAMTARRGIAGVFLFRPTPPPPMTREQSLRGPDQPMPWLLLATAHDADALDDALDPTEFRSAAGPVEFGRYTLAHTATAQEAARTAAPPFPELRD